MKIAQLKGSYLSTPFLSLFLGMSYNTILSTNLYAVSLHCRLIFTVSQLRS